TILVTQPGPVLATFAIIVAGNALVAFGIVLVFRYYSLRTALTLAASLSQIGEFSFILAGLGVDLKILPEAGRALILAGALLSILINPLLFVAVARLTPWLKRREQVSSAATPAGHAAGALLPTSLNGHAVLVGYGRVGSLVAEALERKRHPLLVIEDRPEIVAQ